MEEECPDTEAIQSIQVGKRRSSLGALSKSRPVTKLKSMFETKGTVSSAAPKPIGKLKPVSMSHDGSSFTAAMAASFNTSVAQTVAPPAPVPDLPPATPTQPTSNPPQPQLDAESVPHPSPPLSTDDGRMSPLQYNDSVCDGSEADARSAKSPGSAGFLKRMGSSLKKVLTPKSSSGKQKRPSYAGSETSNISPRPSGQLVLTPHSQPSSNSLDLNCRSDQMQQPVPQSPGASPAFEAHSAREDQDWAGERLRDGGPDAPPSRGPPSHARPPLSPQYSPAAAAFQAESITPLVIPSPNDVKAFDVPLTVSPDESPNKAAGSEGESATGAPMAAEDSFMSADAHPACPDQNASPVSPVGADNALAASLTTSPTVPDVGEGIVSSPPMREVNMGAGCSPPLSAAQAPNTAGDMEAAPSVQPQELVFPTLAISDAEQLTQAPSQSSDTPPSSHLASPPPPAAQPAEDIDMAPHDSVPQVIEEPSPCLSPGHTASAVDAAAASSEPAAAGMDVEMAEAPLPCEAAPAVEPSFGPIQPASHHSYSTAIGGLDLSGAVTSPERPKSPSSPSSPEATTPTNFGGEDMDACIIGLTPVRPDTVAMKTPAVTPTLSTVAESPPEAPSAMRSPGGCAGTPMCIEQLQVDVEPLPCGLAEPAEPSLVLESSAASPALLPSNLNVPPPPAEQPQSMAVDMDCDDGPTASASNPAATTAASINTFGGAPEEPLASPARHEPAGAVATFDTSLGMPSAPSASPSREEPAPASSPAPVVAAEGLVGSPLATDLEACASVAASPVSAKSPVQAPGLEAVPATTVLPPCSHGNSTCSSSASASVAVHTSPSPQPDVASPSPIGGEAPVTEPLSAAALASTAGSEVQSVVPEQSCGEGPVTEQAVAMAVGPGVSQGSPADAPALTPARLSSSTVIDDTPPVCAPAAEALEQASTAQQSPARQQPSPSAAPVAAPEVKSSPAPTDVAMDIEMDDARPQDDSTAAAFVNDGTGAPDRDAVQQASAVEAPSAEASFATADEQAAEAQGGDADSSTQDLVESCSPGLVQSEPEQEVPSASAAVIHDEQQACLAVSTSGGTTVLPVAEAPGAEQEPGPGQGDQDDVAAPATCQTKPDLDASGPSAAGNAKVLPIAPAEKAGSDLEVLGGSTPDNMCDPAVHHAVLQGEAAVTAEPTVEPTSASQLPPADQLLKAEVDIATTSGADAQMLPEEPTTSAPEEPVLPVPEEPAVIAPEEPASSRPEDAALILPQELAISALEGPDTDMMDVDDSAAAPPVVEAVEAVGAFAEQAQPTGLTSSDEVVARRRSAEPAALEAGVLATCTPAAEPAESVEATASETAAVEVEPAVAVPEVEAANDGQAASTLGPLEGAGAAEDSGQGMDLDGDLVAYGSAVVDLAPPQVPAILATAVVPAPAAEQPHTLAASLQGDALPCVAVAEPVACARPQPAMAEALEPSCSTAPEQSAASSAAVCGQTSSPVEPEAVEADDPMMVSPMPQRLALSLMADPSNLPATPESAKASAPQSVGTPRVPTPISPETAHVGVRAFQLDDIEEPEAPQESNANTAEPKQESAAVHCAEPDGAVVPDPTAVLAPMAEEAQAVALVAMVAEVPVAAPAPIIAEEPELGRTATVAEEPAATSTSTVEPPKPSPAPQGAEELAAVSVAMDAEMSAPSPILAIARPPMESAQAGAAYTAAQAAASDTAAPRDARTVTFSSPVKTPRRGLDVPMADSLEAIEALWGNDDLLTETGPEEGGFGPPLPLPQAASSPVSAAKMGAGAGSIGSARKVAPDVVLQVQRESLDLFSLRNSCAGRVSDSLMVESLDSFEGAGICGKSRAVGFVPMAPLSEQDERADDEVGSPVAIASFGGAAPTQAPVPAGQPSTNLTFTPLPARTSPASEGMPTPVLQPAGNTCNGTPSANKPAALSSGSRTGMQTPVAPTGSAGPSKGVPATSKGTTPGSAGRTNAAQGTALKALAAANTAGATAGKAPSSKRLTPPPPTTGKPLATPLAAANGQGAAGRVPACAITPGTGVARPTGLGKGFTPSPLVAGTPAAVAALRTGLTPVGLTPGSAALLAGARTGLVGQHLARTGTGVGLFDTPVILRAAAAPLADSPFTGGDFDLDTVDISAEASRAIAMLGGGDNEAAAGAGATTTQHATPVLAGGARAAAQAATPTMSVMETHVQLLTSKLAEAEAALMRTQEENAMLRDQLSTLQFENSMSNDLDMEREARQFLEQELAVVRHRSEAAEAELRAASEKLAALKTQEAEGARQMQVKEAEWAREKAEMLKAMQQAQADRDTAVSSQQQAEARFNAGLEEAQAAANAALAKSEQESAKYKELQATLGLQAHQLVQVQRLRDEAEAKFQKAMEQLITAQTAHKKQVLGLEQKIQQQTPLIQQFAELGERYKQVKQRAVDTEQRAQRAEAKAQEMSNALATAQVEKAELLRMCNELLTQLEATKGKGGR